MSGNMQVATVSKGQKFYREVQHHALTENWVVRLSSGLHLCCSCCSCCCCSCEWWWYSRIGESLNRLVKSKGGGGGTGLVTSQTCLADLRSVLSLWQRSSALRSLKLRTLMFSTHSANSSLLKTLLLQSSLLVTMLVNSWNNWVNLDRCLIQGKGRKFSIFI
jgi:hypothetical protein